MMQCLPPMDDCVYSKLDSPWKLNSCAVSIRQFPLPREQEVWSQQTVEQDMWSPNLNQGFEGETVKPFTFDASAKPFTFDAPKGEDGFLQDIYMLSSALKLNEGKDNPAFNSSEDTDDDSAKAEAVYGEGGFDAMPDREGTTVMLCNIPCRVGRTNIVSALEDCGFADKYDFIHLPKGKSRRYRRHGNIGYGFINFANLEDAEGFAEAFEDFQFPGLRSTKKCTVKLAHLQGYNVRSTGAKKAVAEPEESDVILSDAMVCKLSL